MESNFQIKKYTLASKNIRMVNLIIDLIVYSLLINLFFIFVDNLSDNNKFSSWYDTLDVYQSYLLNSLFILLYYLITETVFSRSFSKFITKTIVVKIDGSKPGFMDILTRSVIRIFPFEYLTFLNGRNLGWHDEYSNTFVVDKIKFEKSYNDFQELEK